MSKKISRTLIGGRSVITGRAGQALKLGGQGRLHWKDIGEASLNPKWYGSRGVWPGGWTATNQISYITISTTGDASDFGNLTVARGYTACCAGGGRGIIAGGYTGSTVNVIDYITISTTGDAADFGDLPENKRTAAAVSNATRGVFIGGHAGGDYTKTIQYVTILTTGNTTNFGDYTVKTSSLEGVSNGFRGVT